MRLDDLAPLIGAPVGPDIGLRQGVVVAWDSTSGANTVEVGGAELTDLGVLDLGGGYWPVFSPGDVLILVRWRSMYFILGRLMLPSEESGVG